MHSPLTATLLAAVAATALASAPSALASGNTVPEGNFGATRAQVSIELDQPVPHLPVTVSYATHDGTATAGQDYLPTSGSVTFGPFDTEREVRVTVLGDTLYEGDESFFVDTSSTGAGDNEGEGKRVTIADDDPAPAVSIGDATASESGGSAHFDVSMSAPSGVPTTVSYATVDESAVAGSDYAAKSGFLTFAPGETSRSVSVDVLNDAVHEDTESFSLALGNPVGATLGKAAGRATVIDDDPLVAAAGATPIVVSLANGAPQAPLPVQSPSNARSAVTIAVQHAHKHRRHRRHRHR